MPLCLLFLAVIRSLPLTNLKTLSSNFLAKDFFLTLIFILTFWIVFIMICVCQIISTKEADLACIIIIFFAYIFIWWEKKVTRDDRE